MIGLSRLIRAIADVPTGGMQTGNPKVVLKLADAQRIKAELEGVIAERDALAAQVEALTAHGNALATAASMATGAMAVGSPVTKFCVEAVKRFNAVKASTPQQCLRDVKAEAGRAGYLQGYEDSMMTKFDGFSKELADEYAAKVREGGTE